MRAFRVTWTSATEYRKGVCHLDTLVGPGFDWPGPTRFFFVLDGKGATSSFRTPPDSLGTATSAFGLGPPTPPSESHHVVSKLRGPRAGALEIQVRADGRLETYAGRHRLTQPFTRAREPQAREWHMAGHAPERNHRPFPERPCTAVAVSSAANLDNVSDFFIGHTPSLSEDWRGPGEVRGSRKAWLRMASSSFPSATRPPFPGC